MPAKPGVSNVRTVAPGSASGRGGAAGAASSGVIASGGADRCAHRMRRIRTHVRPPVKPDTQKARLGRVGPSGTAGSALLRGQLLLDLGHVQRLDLLDEALER